MFIYKITNKTNGEFYIGKTKNENPQQRWTMHLYNAFNYKHETYLCRALRKYGKSNFVFEVLFCVTDSAFMDEMEILFIDELNPNYNMTKGGDGGRTADSPNFIRSMAIYHSNLNYDDYATNGFKGKKHKEETKAVQSERRKKYWDSLDNESYKNRCDQYKGDKNPMYGKTPKNATKIKYDGVVYESLRAAADATGLSIYFLKKNGEILNDGL